MGAGFEHAARHQVGAPDCPDCHAIAPAAHSAACGARDAPDREQDPEARWYQHSCGAWNPPGPCWWCELERGL